MTRSFARQVSQAAAAAASSAVGGDMRHHLGQHNGGSTSGMPGHHTNQQMSQQDTLPPDLGKSTLSLRRSSFVDYYCYLCCRRSFDRSSRKESIGTISFQRNSSRFTGEALRLQEQRLEQALRLHGDPRALSFTLQHVVNQQNNQQP